MTSRHRVPSPMMDGKLIFPTLGNKFDSFYYGQTHSSPYKLPLVTISIGEDKYGIPWSYLERYHRLDRLNRSGSLKLPVSPDIGHTIVHFLYTGKWQTVDSGLSRNKTYMEREYQRCVQVYHASIKYDLRELKTMAEQYIAHFGKEYSAIELLRLTSEVFSEFPEDEFWLPKYVTNALQEMVTGVKSKVNTRDNSTVGSPGSLAIMAAVIEVQYSRILELESTRGAYHPRPGVHMHGFGTDYYPNSRHFMHPMYPMPVRPTSPGSAVDSTSPGVRRYHMPATPSSEACPASPGSRRHPRAASYSSEESSDGVREIPVTPDESSEHSVLTKDYISTKITEDGSPMKESTSRPDGTVMEEPVEMVSYEESIVEAVEASVYEESIAENSVTEEHFTEEPADEWCAEVPAWEEPVPDEPVAEELTEEAPIEEAPIEEALTEEVPAEEEPVKEPSLEGTVAESIVAEADQTQPLLLNSQWYDGWKDLSKSQRRERTKILKHEGLPIPSRNGVISISLS